MKAIVYPEYGPPEVLRFQEMPQPSPADSEVLIRLHAASVNPLDFHQMRGHVRLVTGLRGPKQPILGCDIAGRVEAVGANVKVFRPGDEVFGVSGLAGGGFAEYVCVCDEKFALKPSNISFEDAAAVPIAGTTALQGLRDKGRIQPGQRVLVDGASGGVGTFSVQLAKSFGAEVTAVCSTSKLETARSIGADYVIDYTHDDFTKRGECYDLILGANAVHSLFDYRRALAPGGIYVMAGGGTKLRATLFAVLLCPILSMAGNNRMVFFVAKVTRDDLEFLRGLLETGKIRPVIDRCYRLADAAEAVRYLEGGHARGKVILRAEV